MSDVNHRFSLIIQNTFIIAFVEKIKSDSSTNFKIPIVDFIRFYVFKRVYLYNSLSCNLLNTNNSYCYFDKTTMFTI